MFSGERSFRHHASMPGCLFACNGLQRLQEVRPSLHFVVTATSRAMRPGEVHGQDYFFVTRDEFETLIEAQELLEHAVVYGEYKGIPKQQVAALTSRTPRCPTCMSGLTWARPSSPVQELTPLCASSKRSSRGRCCEEFSSSLLFLAADKGGCGAAN